MQLVWILLIAAAITVIEILIYHYRLPRFFLFIFPLINICLERAIIRYGYESVFIFCRFCYPCLS